jgi:ankyrin repeat protein
MDDELFDAVEAGDIDEVRTLLDGEADVNATNPERETSHGTPLTRPYVTPLHQAAERANTDMVKLLLDHGAAVDGHDGYGNTPLFWAVWDNHTEVVKLLLDSGADANAKNSAGTSLVSKASEDGNNEIVALLTQHGGE